MYQMALFFEKVIYKKIIMIVNQYIKLHHFLKFSLVEHAPKPPPPHKRHDFTSMWLCAGYCLGTCKFTCQDIKCSIVNLFFQKSIFFRGVITITE